MKTLAPKIGLIALLAFPTSQTTWGEKVTWLQNGHQYELVVQNGVSWPAAKAAAEARGGYLATATSAAENSFIVGIANDPAAWVQHDPLIWCGPWIGGVQTSDNGSQPGENWTWGTGEPFSFTAWTQGEPNNFNGLDQRYIALLSLNGTPSGDWDDGSDPTNGFIVEYDDSPPVIVQSQVSPLTPIVGQPVSVSCYWSDANPGDFITGNKFRIKKDSEAYGSPIDMRFVNGSGEPPLFVNSAPLQFDYPGEYTIQFIADDATWQGDTVFTVVPAETTTASGLVASLGVDGHLSVTATLTGNNSQIPIQFSIIPSGGDSSTPAVSNTTIFRTASSGEPLTIVYPRPDVQELDPSQSYKVRLSYFAISDSSEYSAFSNVFSPSLVATEIVNLIGPGYAVSPGAPETFTIEIDSSHDGPVLAQIQLQSTANGGNLYSLPSPSPPLTLSAGRLTDQISFTTPLSIPLTTYNVHVSLWQDSNGDGQFQTASDTQISSSKICYEGLTLYSGNNPNDLNNDGLGDTWANENSITNAFADDDGDGKPNWQEHAMDSDPNGLDGSLTRISSYIDEATGEEFVEFGYHRIIGSDDVYAFLIQTTADFQEWSDASLCFQPIAAQSTGPNSELVTFRCTLPIGEANHEAFRVRVQRKFENGPDLFFRPDQVVGNAQRLENSTLGVPRGSFPSVEYLKQVAQIIPETRDLVTSFGVFEHFEHYDSIASPALKFIQTSLSPPPPAGDLLFFGDRQLDLQLRIEIDQTLASSDSNYLNEIRANGLVGVSQGDGTMLIPDALGKIIEVNILTAFDQFGPGATNALFLGALSPFDAQQTFSYPTTIQEKSNRMATLLARDPSSANAVICATELPAPDNLIGFTETIWGDFIVPPPNLDASIAVLLDTGWNSVPLSVFYNNGPLNRLGLWIWLAEQRTNAVPWNNENPFSLHVAICASELPVLHKLNILPLEIIGADGTTLSELKIGKMEGAISEEGVLDIDKDIDRFFVRLKGCAELRTASVTLETINPDPEYDDSPDKIALEKDGNDLISNSLLLVSDDVDDSEFIDGILVNNSDNERTHKIQLGGTALVSEVKIGDVNEAVSISASCNAIQKLDFMVYILRESAGGEPAASIKDVEDELRRAQNRYSQVALELNWNIQITDPPNEIDLLDGLDIEPLVNPEVTTLFSLASEQTSDVEVFIVNRLNDPGFTTYGVGFAEFADTVYGYEELDRYKNNVIINWEGTSSNEGRNVIAHELGHVLVNFGHFGGPLNLMENGSTRNTTIDILGGRRLTRSQQNVILGSHLTIVK